MNTCQEDVCVIHPHVFACLPHVQHHYYYLHFNVWCFAGQEETSFTVGFNNSDCCLSGDCSFLPWIQAGPPSTPVCPLHKTCVVLLYLVFVVMSENVTC